VNDLSDPVELFELEASDGDICRLYLGAIDAPLSIPSFEEGIGIFVGTESRVLLI
jgi:hypothetical protein